MWISEKVRELRLYYRNATQKMEFYLTNAWLLKPVSRCILILLQMHYLFYNGKSFKNAKVQNWREILHCGSKILTDIARWWFSSHLRPFLMQVVFFWSSWGSSKNILEPNLHNQVEPVQISDTHCTMLHFAQCVSEIWLFCFYQFSIDIAFSKILLTSEVVKRVPKIIILLLLSCFATSVLRMRLLHVFAFSKKLRWLAQTNVISLKTQLHAVNARWKRLSQLSFTKVQSKVLKHSIYSQKIGFRSNAKCNDGMSSSSLHH